MERRNHFYVSSKNLLTTLMALCMVCSAVARLVLPGLKGSGDALYTWSQIILPLAAALLYVSVTLLRGHEQFHQTAVSVWMMAIYGMCRTDSWLYRICLFLGAVL